MKKIVNNIILCIKYPFLLPRNRWNGKVIRWDWVWSYLKKGDIKNALHSIYHFEYTELDAMPDGWRKVFGEQMCEDIKQELIRCSKVMNVHNYRISEIKEKYGALRWYDMGSPVMSKIPDIINYYEDLSRCYCINCGEPVRYITKGWIEYLCPACFLKNKRLGHRVTEEDIPKRYKFDTLTGKHMSYDSGVNFKKLWGLEQKEVD